MRTESAILQARIILEKIYARKPKLHQFSPFENRFHAENVLAGVPNLLSGKSYLGLVEELSTRNQENSNMTMLVVPDIPLVITDTGDHITATVPVLSGTRQAIKQASATIQPADHYFLSADGSLNDAVLDNLEQGNDAFCFDPKTMNPAEFIALATTTFINEPFQLHFRKGDTTFTPQAIEQEKSYATSIFLGEKIVFERQNDTPRIKQEAQLVFPKQDKSPTDIVQTTEESLPEIGIASEHEALVIPDWIKIRFKTIKPTHPRTRRAGQSLFKARLRHRVSSSAIAEKTDLDEGRVYGNIIEDFERGRTALDLKAILSSAKSLIKEADPDVTNLEQMAREDQWVNALTREGISLGRGVMLMRLDLQQDRKHFARDAHVGKNQLRKIEGNVTTPIQSEIRRLIESSRLDMMGIPAQLIRLLREKREPMEARALLTCTFGELFQYIRMLKGDSIREAAKSVGISRGTIVHLEKVKRYKPKEDVRRELLRYLDLDPESALAKIAQTKLDEPDESIPPELIKLVISGTKDGQYLFKEMLKYSQISESNKAVTLITDVDDTLKQLLEEEERDKVFGLLMQHLRKRRSLSVPQLARHASVTARAINAIENGAADPYEATLSKLFHGMEIDILDPAAWVLLDIANILATEAYSKETRIEFGDIILINGKPIHLNESGAAIFAELVHKKEKIVSHKMLVRTYNPYGEEPSPHEIDTLQKYIYNIRHTLRQTGERVYLEAIRGEGYRLRTFDERAN